MLWLEISAVSLPPIKRCLVVDAHVLLVTLLFFKFDSLLNKSANLPLLQ